MRGGKRWLGGLRGDGGSMTLEASLVLPGVLVVTFALILLAATTADRVAHYYAVSVAGERAAFAWPHSAADIRTGGYPAGQYDGLYWRLKDDAMLAGLFFGGADEDEGRGASVRIGPAGGTGDEAGDGHSLAARKLRKSASSLPDGTQGTIVYRNRIWLREVEVVAEDAAMPDPLRRLWPMLSPTASASVSAVVIEPAEWLRTFELVRYYKAKFEQKGSRSEAYRDQAASVLESRR